MCALNPRSGYPPSHQEVTGSDLLGWGGLGFGALGCFLEPQPSRQALQPSDPICLWLPQAAHRLSHLSQPYLGTHTHSTHSREDPQHPFPQRDWNLGGKCELRK